MTWYPISYLPIQYEDNAGKPYQGAVLKAYEANTTTPILMATNAQGVTTASSFTLNASGYPVYSGSVIIPHIQEDFKLALYPTQAAADANSGALWTITEVKIAEASNTSFFQSFSGDGTTTVFTLSQSMGTDEKVLMVFADKKFGEYTQNGTFDTDSNWTKGAGWSISAGVATATGAISTDLTQTALLPLIQRESYTITYTITRSAGGIIPKIGGTSGTERTASGTYTETIIAGSTQAITFTGNGFTGTVDNVSVYRTTASRREILRPDEYTLSGSTLTIAEAPASGTNNILVIAPILLVGTVSNLADAAAVSETNAAASALAAQTAETNAETAETNAETAATNAQSYAAQAASAAAEGLYRDVTSKVFGDSPIVPLITEEGTLFRCDCTSGNIVVNLSALSTYAEDVNFAFVKVDSSVNTLTINRGGTNTINGNTSLVISTQYEVHVIVGDSASGTWVDSVQAAGLADGQVTYNKCSPGVQASLNLADAALQPGDSFSAPLLHLQDQKSSGTAGGGFTSGSWQTRTLNTEVTDEIGSTLSSNQFTLPAGTYEIEANVPGYSCNVHQARLYNTTDAASVLIGTNAYSANGAYSITPSLLNGRFTIAGTKTFELQHRCSFTKATDGFGLATSWGTEIYAEVRIRKVA